MRKWAHHVRAASDVLLAISQ